MCCVNIAKDISTVSRLGGGKEKENSENMIFERFVQASFPAIDMEATLVTSESPFIEQAQEAVKYERLYWLIVSLLE